MLLAHLAYEHGHELVLEHQLLDVLERSLETSAATTRQRIAVTASHIAHRSELPLVQIAALKERGGSFAIVANHLAHLADHEQERHDEHNLKIGFHLFGLIL